MQFLWKSFHLKKLKKSYPLRNPNNSLKTYEYKEAKIPKVFKKGIIASIMVFLIIWLLDSSAHYAGSMWFIYFIIASVMQARCIEGGKPKYKKIFLIGLWISAALTGVILLYLYFAPQIAMIKYGIDLTEPMVIIFLGVWSIIICYIQSIIIGLLTVCWISDSMHKNVTKTDIKLRQKAISSSNPSDNNCSYL